MGVRDARRLGPVQAAIDGRITNAKGAELTGLSLRQFKRLRARVQQRGARGLLHGNRGRPSPRRLDPGVREQIITLLQHPDARLNDCHVRDTLAARQVEVSVETVRQVRRALGLAPKRRRRPPRHHRRRLRAARIGSLVLMDGSTYAWLGAHQSRFTLMGMLDDATGEPLSLVRRPNEDLHGYTQALREVITTFGVPEALYGDRTGIAIRNDRYWTVEEELAGRQQPTQFGQMLEELGIHYIAAHSPEAKGRIERHWQTLQDRLPAELALHGIRTLDGVDRVLPAFMVRGRSWFGRAPRERVPAWRAAPRHLDRILACRYPRVVSRDNVVSVCGRTLHLPPGPHQRSYAQTRVEVRELLDGRLLVLHQDRVLLEHPAPPHGGFALVSHRSPRNGHRLSNDPEHRKSLRRPARPPDPLPAGDRNLLARTHRRPKADHPLRRQHFTHQPPDGAAREG